jgi:hypothetical protein
MDRQNHADAADRKASSQSTAGAQPAHFFSGEESQWMGGGDRDHPGEKPDEIVPNKPDIDRPARTPDEVQPGQGDFDRPDSAPAESPPQPGTAPAETPPPPD